MLEPVGPLPPAVYWRRRAAALVAVVAAIALLLWIVTRIFNGGDASPALQAASSSGQASSGEASAEATDKPGASGSESESASDSSNGKSSASKSAESESSAGKSPASKSSASAGSSAPASSRAAPSATAEPTPPPAPAGPVVCDNSQIEVQAAVASDPIRSGDKPKLVLSVVNHAQADCQRDLNSAGQELLVYDANGARLWSSNDCYPESSNDTRMLTPGQKVDFTVTWSGKSSSPGCATPRQTVGAGSYYLEAAQGGVVSQRVGFTINP